MIQLRLTVSDLGRARFAYSPLAELAESLHVLASGRVPVLHERWYKKVRTRNAGGGFADVDMALLRALVPGRPVIADFLLAAAVDRTTTIEGQLAAVAQMPAQQLSGEIHAVWQGQPLPRRARELVAAGPAGPRRLADALWGYWCAALQPHWPVMRAVLDDDVVFRATELTNGGVATMLSGLHPEVSMCDEHLRIDKKASAEHPEKSDLSGVGLLLVPSVFVWPNVIFATSPAGPPSLTYPARGVANLSAEADEPDGGDALGALLGRTRAAILVALALPYSTTELSLELGQSPSSVSQHLSVLRRSGLLTSWRSGRRVLYQRTAMATSIVDATGVPPESAASPA